MISVLDCGSSGLVGIPLPFLSLCFIFCVIFVKQAKEKTVEALVSYHLGNSKKWSQLELVAYKNELS